MSVNGISNVNFITPMKFGNEQVESTTDFGTNFGDYLKSALDNVNNLQLESQQMGDDFAAGKTDNIHQVMIATEKADVALQLTLQIRNKLMDAYSEIMRMQI